MSTGNLGEGVPSVTPTGDDLLPSALGALEDPPAANGDGDYSLIALTKLIANVLAGSFVPLGAHISGTPISSFVTLTATRPAGATHILIGVSTKGARYTLDGTNPTATIGHLLYPDDPPILLAIDIDVVMKIIQTEATCLLNAQWGHLR